MLTSSVVVTHLAAGVRILGRIFFSADLISIGKSVRKAHSLIPCSDLSHPWSKTGKT